MKKDRLASILVAGAVSEARKAL
uniref:Uncharacterized protein n=1 Tax=Timema cristinae TaxID=61476 RepID=A0A7R9HET0_TIMCR|nr:unnamed protein product [Timema cristinae]